MQQQRSYYIGNAPSSYIPTGGGGESPPISRAMDMLAARRVVERIILEHMAHAGTENGNLIVTYADFSGYGIRDKTITTAIAVAEALGWIEITVHGKASFEDQRYASRYAL